MKFLVNENCIGCGLCESICPEVFTMTDEGVAVASTDLVAPENEDAAIDAQASCPVSAIEKAED